MVERGSHDFQRTNVYQCRSALQGERNVPGIEAELQAIPQIGSQRNSERSKTRQAGNRQPSQPAFRPKSHERCSGVSLLQKNRHSQPGHDLRRRDLGNRRSSATIQPGTLPDGGKTQCPLAGTLLWSGRRCFTETNHAYPVQRLGGRVVSL